MIKRGTFVYEAPAILDSFDALDIMGSAEGFEVYVVGNGSQLPTIAIAR